MLESKNYDLQISSIFSNPKPLKITKMLLDCMTQLWLSHHFVHLPFPICASPNNSASCTIIMP